MKPTNEEKLQVVEGLFKTGEALQAAADSGDQKLMLTTLTAATSTMITALAMILVADTTSPKMEQDQAQLLLFQDVDADDLPTT